MVGPLIDGVVWCGGSQARNESGSVHAKALIDIRDPRVATTMPLHAQRLPLTLYVASA